MQRFESRVKIQQIIENQLPEFILSENPKFVEFLKQYYISQEFMGGPADISENLDQYLKLDNLTPEVILGNTVLTKQVSENDDVIEVESTKGFPPNYGLIKINDEIITYKELTPTSFEGCVRGFSGISNYQQPLNKQELVFEQSSISSHSNQSVVHNLSTLFLIEFYKKLKFSLTPGLENLDFSENLNVSNFIKEARSFYESKGTDESFRILFNILYNETPTIINLENFLLKPSDAFYKRRFVVVAKPLSGNLSALEGQTVYKNDDDVTTASVSEVESFTKNGNVYYKINLFVGYDDSYPTITGTFDVTKNTRVVDEVTISNINNKKSITVDSTIGFDDSGIIYNNDNEIFYVEKTINQFLGCYTDSESDLNLEKTSYIYGNDTYYGYEDGDLEKKVTFLITGVLSDAVINKEEFNFIEDDIIIPRNVGQKVEKGTSKKEIFANTWIYNTSPRYQISTFNGSNINTFVKIDDNILKSGDKIEILKRNTEIIPEGYDYEITVQSVSEDGTILVDTSLTGLGSGDYDIRRIVKKSSSSTVPIQYGNDQILSDVQNVYFDIDDTAYIASNSLPSYEIDTKLLKYKVSGFGGFIQSLNSYTEIYFDEIVSFLNGDKVFYIKDENYPISGLDDNFYYVEVLSDKKGIRLYQNGVLIPSENFINFQFEFENFGNNQFILFEQKDELIHPQKILKKIDISQTVDKFEESEIIPGPIGMLKNGIEIYSYKTNDIVYYGPLKNVSILNGGTDYDVINPPLLEVDGNAKIEPVIKGSFQKVLVDPQDFDFERIVSVNITGGNGSGAKLDPVVEQISREIEFDARPLSLGGGLDYDSERISFIKPHGLINGQEITYKSSNNSLLGIEEFGGSNADSGRTLIDGSIYYPEIINDRTIIIYENYSDYFSGINTVGFTTIGNSGIQKFRISVKNVLSEIRVVDGGEGYSYRKLRVSPSGISTTNHYIEFNDHGFSDGEIINYTYETSEISGISSSLKYKVLYLDNNRFRIADAGVDGQSDSDYERRKYVKFETQGNGYQIFSYPEINLVVNFSTPSSISTSITVTPIVRGSIDQVYLYESGSDYGSTTLNNHNRPKISIKTGKEAQLSPIIENGKIINVRVLYGGYDYYSTPDIVVESTTGIGAVLRPILRDQKIVDIIIISPGLNYNKNNTTIYAKPAGFGAVLQANIRDLFVNRTFKLGTQNQFYRDPASDVILSNSNNNLQYAITSYSEIIKQSINDNNDLENKHSDIIGWAYDGNPIYGSFGFSDPEDINSPVKRLEPSYELTSIENRPSTSIFPLGYFIDDYKFNSSSDLDQYNGRYGKTKDFPEGTYAYFATTEINDDQKIVGKFPYFIGDKFKSNYYEENKNLDQSFNLNETNVLRNTHPYGILNINSDNDFIVESNEITLQKTYIDSVSSGNVNGYEIVKAGTDYRVNDTIIFESTNQGTNPYLKISEVEGKEVLDINTEYILYKDSIIVWKNENIIEVNIFPYHEFNDNDNVNISGLSTDNINLGGLYPIKVENFSSVLQNALGNFNQTGINTDIFVNYIPENVSVGSSILINDEYFSIIGIFPVQNILKIQRDNLGVSHTTGSTVNYLPSKFSFKKEVEKFNSNVSKKINFNPQKSVGVGIETGGGVNVSYTIGLSTYNQFVPTQSIFIQNHPFKTGDKVKFAKPSTSTPIPVEIPNVGTINIPDNIDELYVINKSKDFIGFQTTVGLSTNSNGIFFLGNGSDNYNYTMETIEKDQILADSIRIDGIVSVSTSHNLDIGDQVNFKVKPNTNVGVGTTNKIIVKYVDDNLLVNPIGFSSLAVDIENNTINIENNNFYNGQKVYYRPSTQIISGLQTGEYFIYKVDDNLFKLCDTYLDSISIPPLTLNFADEGGQFHILSAINPEIFNYKNNNLVFDLSDSSLEGYDLNFYYDQEFKNEFNIFTNDGKYSVVSSGGTVGLGSEVRKILNFSEDTPKTLYYTLTNSGKYIENLDEDVINYCKITSIDSLYNGVHNVIGIGTTVFTLSLKNIPEKLSYSKNDCDILEYSTNSVNSSGPISKIDIISQGYGLKKLPSFSTIESVNGSGAFIVPKSNTIGKIIQSSVRNEGFEYSSDKTLRPSASIPQEIYLSDSNTIESIDILFGGSEFNSSPDLVIINTDTREVINSGYLRAVVSGSSISDIIIDIIPNGLPIKPATLKTINNSNGINIDKVEYSSSGIVTCIITTPIFGFTQQPFENGDYIFVEGIENENSEGDGLNSTDLGFNFFKIVNYYATNPVKFEYDVSEFTNNGGSPKFIQEGYATVIRKDKYPEFIINQTSSEFLIGENLLINSELTDNYILSKKPNRIRIIGPKTVQIGDKISGKSSNSSGTVDYVQNSSGYYNISWQNLKNFDWKYDTGKLNQNFQVLPDNDYYQNLSYSVKSSKSWEEIVGNVNSLLHTSGMKNFADMQVSSSSQSGIRTEFTESILSSVNSYISDLRVDRINYFDYAIDINTSNNVSRFLKFKNTYLLDFILCKSNNVLSIDDISSQFSSRDDAKSFSTNLNILNTSNGYYKFYVQSKDLISGQIQLNEIISLNNNSNIYTLFKSDLTNKNKIVAEINPILNNSDYFLSVTPNDPDNSAIVFKTLSETLTGIAETSGNFNLNCIIIKGDRKNSPVGSSVNIFELNSDDFNAAHVSAYIHDDQKNNMNYVEIYATHDGSNTYMNEYFFDSDATSGFDTLGTFNFSLVGGNFVLEFSNDFDEALTINTKVVGFGTTSLGNGEYRFKLDNQPVGSERSLLYETSFDDVISGSTNIFELSSDQFSAVKSVVRINQGQNSSLHQIMTICDGEDAYISQYPFLSVGQETGIGSFGVNYDTNSGLFNLFFTPDNYSDVAKIQSLNMEFYKDFDFVNSTPTLEYEPYSESINLSAFYGVNVDFGIAYSFETNSNNFPIFAKTFDPSNSSILDLSSGIFSIENHYFRTGEKLIYTPGSSFIGIGSESMEIVPTENNSGVVTDRLPKNLYAIRDDDNTFRVATTRERSIVGHGVTFTSVGIGNAHVIEMLKKNEKAIITINNVVQYPISYTYITHSLSGNGGLVSAGTSFIALSGISSIRPSDILKVDDEYMKVESVGLSDNNIGPITFSGNIPLVQISRGVLGSIESEHLDGTTVDVYRGSYNIEKNKIHFVDPPRGNQLDLFGLNESKLPRERDTFTGRVFLRDNYDSNQVYDDISEKFTGIGQTFNLTKLGVSTVGLGTSGGTGMVFINGIFQAPTTENNSENNYFIEENLNLGISSITFTGIEYNDEIFIDEFDINKNQLPRGGVIISYGSTPGLGYAPLVGASVEPVIVSGSFDSLIVNNIGSGYRDPVSIAVTDPNHTGTEAIISATVGLGGTLSFSIQQSGSGYSNEAIVNIEQPSYENIPVTGISRLSVGPTEETGIGLLMNIEIGAAKTSVGIGSTLFEVSNFKIVRNGYGFQKGDVFKPVGLVTDKNLNSPLEEFKITVLDTFSDSFSAIQFGDLDYIDSVKSYQNGERVRFPLIYNGELLSFETDQLDDQSNSIDLNNVLIIFVNGILQEPGSSYQFDGGSSFVFRIPPKKDDNVQIFFYKGISGVDSIQFDVDETIKIGDNLQVISDNANLNNTQSQRERTVYSISSADVVQTESYQYEGIDDVNYKPIHWTKQKTDIIVNNQIVSKARPSLKTQIYPTSNIIANFSSLDTVLYVDNSEIWNYEDDQFLNVDGLIFSNSEITGIGTTLASENYETITGITDIDGFVAQVVEISPTTGIGVPLGIEFKIERSPFTFPGFGVGDYFYISNTTVGNGVTSIGVSDFDLVSISTSHLNNIYKVASFDSISGTIVCNVMSGSNLVGIETTGSISYPVGTLSWGRLSGFSRRTNNPLDLTVNNYTSSNSGLSTYPVIQRRNSGIRKTGAI